MRPCVHPPRVESLFLPVLWSSYDQTLLAFKARCSGGSFSWCQTPKLGSLMWGSDLSLLWENLCDIIIFQFVGRPPDRYVRWFYRDCAPPTISLWFLLCFGEVDPPLNGQCSVPGWGQKALLVAIFAVAESVNEAVSLKWVWETLWGLSLRDDKVIRSHFLCSH